MPGDLDRLRLRDYFLRVLGGSGPDDAAMEESRGTPPTRTKR